MPKELRTDRRDDVFKEYVIARVERSGEKFEVLVKPGAVQRLRDGKDVDILAELAIDEVFRDAHKGSKASEEKMNELFGTTEPLAVAKQIILKGEIEITMEEAKVHVDPFKGLEVQVKDVLDALRPLIPIRFEKVRIAVRLSAEDGAKCYGDLKTFGTILKEEWQPSGAWIGIVEMPAGMQTDFLERLNAKTKGNVETRTLKADQKV